MEGFPAGWEAGRLGSLITEGITGLDWSLKHHFWASSSCWDALWTGELLPLQEKRRRSCLTGSCGLKEACLFSCGCSCRAGDERQSHGLHRAESTAQQKADLLPSDACLSVAAFTSCILCDFQVLALRLVQRN